MFRCKSLAQLMGFHAENKSKDGFMRIPADSKAMKHIEDKWPRKFKNEPRSIRSGLAIDGVFPFSFLSPNYIIWLVGLIVYNIPPWISVRKEHLAKSHRTIHDFPGLGVCSSTKTSLHIRT